MRPLSCLSLIALALALAIGPAPAQDAPPPATPSPSAPGSEPRSSNPIVEEALKGARQAQEADKGAVDRMSEEAARAAEGAPSGAEAVGSMAPPAQSATRVPSGGAGLSLRAMIDRPIADRDGEPAGTVRDVLLGAEGGGTLVLVETPDGGPARAINAARVLPAPDGGGGYRIDLDREGIASLPGYRREGEGWRLEE